MAGCLHTSSLTSGAPPGTPLGLEVIVFPTLAAGSDRSSRNGNATALPHVSCGRLQGESNYDALEGMLMPGFLSIHTSGAVSQ